MPGPRDVEVRRALFVDREFTFVDRLGKAREPEVLDRLGGGKPTPGRFAGEAVAPRGDRQCRGLLVPVASPVMIGTHWRRHVRSLLPWARGPGAPLTGLCPVRRPWTSGHLTEPGGPLVRHLVGGVPRGVQSV